MSPLCSPVMARSTCTANCLPNSTPHWSKLFTPHIAPCTNVACSYVAMSAPTARGVRREKSSVVLGRLPGVARCARNAASPPTSASVTPKASACDWAIMFATSTS